MASSPHFTAPLSPSPTPSRAPPPVASLSCSRPAPPKHSSDISPSASFNIPSPHPPTHSLARSHSLN
eukprot:61360-Rhodomonas_salina.1